MNIFDVLGKRMVILDGAMGTLLHSRGLGPGQFPEVWNIERPNDVTDIHRAYFEAGSDIVLTNTFGANRYKLKDVPYTIEQLVAAAVNNVKKAKDLSGAAGLVALDIGPTGRLLSPVGDLDFEDAVSAFAEVVRIGADAGADLVFIETMGDTHELKAAVLAAKENCNLPVFACVTCDERGRLLTGGDMSSVASLLEGLGADAIGLNCSLGPEQMEAPFHELLSRSSIPVIVKPNAGMPSFSADGKATYDLCPNAFASFVSRMAEAGAWIVGGCCGTTPEYIRALYEQCTGMIPVSIHDKGLTVVSSASRAVTFGSGPVVIGERINPTGKPRMKQALRDGDMEYILREGLAQEERGAQILDVNVGLPELNEATVMVKVVNSLQGILGLPLQLDAADPAVFESSLRRYDGKAMVNSVNGKAESMEAVFPLVKRYGGVVVGLTLDESGIPVTAEGRLAIARKIVDTAAKYGIAKKDIVIDVLTMAVSSDSSAARTTLDSLTLVRKELGVHTLLGVSNVSFGLPERETLSSVFLTMALEQGLSSAIINPCSEKMSDALCAFRTLSGSDAACKRYIARFGGKAVEAPTQEVHLTLEEAIERGLSTLAERMAKKALESEDPMSVINNRLIPALDRVGKAFETGKLYLPQLLMAAEASGDAFDAIKNKLYVSGTGPEKKGAVILATVKGDIHDIGKNIVKVLLENYGFEVVDLGRDVPPKDIVKTVLARKIKLVCLSALMTTTVPSMNETIKALRLAGCSCKVMVGGAVMNQEYANMIGADFYSPDAMGAVNYAKEVFR